MADILNDKATLPVGNVASRMQGDRKAYLIVTLRIR